MIIGVQYNSKSAVFIRRRVTAVNGKRIVKITPKFHYPSQSSMNRLYNHIALDPNRYVTSAGPGEWDYIPAFDLTAQRGIVPE